MNKARTLLCLLLTAATLVSALAMAMVGGTGGAPETSPSRIQTDITDNYIIMTSPALASASPHWQQIVSTGALMNYTLTDTPAAPYLVSSLNVTWRVDTDVGQVIFAYGAEISIIWMVQGNHSLSVTYYNPGNVSDIGHQYITIQVVTDLDKDGIPDTWERQYFGNLITADNTTDYDHDGFTDLQEFQNGTNPLIANAKPGFLDQYWYVVVIIAIVIVLLVLLQFVVRPNMKAKSEAAKKKEIAAAVEVEKSLLGLEDLEEKPKK